MKVLIATDKPFAKIAVDGIRKVVETAGHELKLLENYKTVEEFKDAVADVEGMIVRSDLVTAEILDAAKKLKIVVRAGAGYDNLDLAACTAHNVVAMNTPGQNANAVAELVFGMLLYNKRGGFKGGSGTELRGKSIGLHAFGYIGKYVAEIAKGFGIGVYAYDPFISECEIRERGISAVRSVEELYSLCNIVSLHLPLTSETRKSIGYDLLSKMPAPATLVNTARKEVIDEEALIKIFNERSDITYISDIEPDCKAVFEEKFADRFLFSKKKMGAQTEEANINAGVAAARQIVDYFATGNETFRVNK